MWFDLIVIGILIIFTIRGAVKGFVYQIATIAAVVLCFFFAESAALFVAPMVPLEAPLDWGVAMAIFFIGFSFISFTIARQMKDWMEKARFEEFDRHLGAAFGFLKGALLSTVMTFFVVTLVDSVREEVLNSKSGYGAAVVMSHLAPVLPDSLMATLEPYLRDVPLPDPGGNSFASGDAPTFGSDDDPGHQHGNNPGLDLLPDINLPRVNDSLLLDPAIVMTEVRRTLSTLTPDQQREFLGVVQSQDAQTVLDLAIHWRNGRTGGGGVMPDPNPIPPVVFDRSAALQEIAVVLTDVERNQQLIVREVNRALTDVPSSIADGAIADWHSDLLDPSTDPDPQTRLTTPLDDRLRRQVQLQKYPVDRLSFSLQQRLRL